MRCLAILVICGIAACADSHLVVSNKSSFEIDEVYITQIENPDWGPNMLDATLLPDESMTLDVCCGTYDTLVVDRTGAACEADSVYLCFDKDDWVIRDNSCFVYDVAPRK